MPGDARGPALVPARHQPPLPLDGLLRRERPGEDAVTLDVLFVGGGPAGLAGAIELARLCRADAASDGGLGPIEIGVLEKAAGLGEHTLSGAVVVPGPFRELFPDTPVDRLPFRGPAPEDRVYLLGPRRRLRLPTPPTMRNGGNHVASLCEIVRWLGERAEEAGVHVFTGFPAESLLLDGGRVVGVRTAATGLGRDGRPGSGYAPPTDVTARVTVLAEGTRGPLAAAWLSATGVGSPNPPIFALGVKELWEVRRPLDAVVHTLGWPLPRDAFGGSFLYPMGGNLAAVGLVVGLDYRQRDLDPHWLLQEMKGHPLFRGVLAGGEMVEWGAKTIPEGGWHALPERLHGDGILLAGDAAGLVDVPSLKGIHYAMLSGMYAARTIFRALKAGDVSATALAGYDGLVRRSAIGRDLYRRRNMRLAFQRGLLAGGVAAGAMTLTGGAFPGGRIASRPDAEQPRVGRLERPRSADGRYTFDKAEAVFRSGNKTRDDIPPHLILPEDVDRELAEFYARMCPAGVYEWREGRLVVHAPNCIDCKATDVLGPRWMPREGGSGPSYKRM